MQDNQEKDPRGAKTLYNLELAERICELVATTDLGYEKIQQKHPELPVRLTVNRWRRKHPEFRAMYAQAKCEQIEFMTSEILDIADDAKNDWMEFHDKQNECIGWRVNGEHIQRSRLRIDTRKWLAAKLVPRLYGDTVTTASTTEVDEDCKKRIEELDERNRKEF
jgi:tyrosyl-tRNA synthetase